MPTLPKRPIILAVSEIDEEAKKAVLEVGGRVEAAWTETIPGNQESYRKAMHTTLVMLPAEKTVISAAHHSSYDITLTISEHVEIYLELDQTANVEDAELTFSERIEYKDDDEQDEEALANQDKTR